MSAPERWLITGGCGFIGTNLIERLLADGKQVRVFDNLTVGSRDSLGAISKFAEVTDGAEWSSGVQLMVRVELCNHCERLWFMIRKPELVGLAVAAPLRSIRHRQGPVRYACAYNTITNQ